MASPSPPRSEPRNGFARQGEYDDCEHRGQSRLASPEIRVGKFALAPDALAFPDIVLPVVASNPHNGDSTTCRSRSFTFHFKITLTAGSDFVSFPFDPDFRLAPELLQRVPRTVRSDAGIELLRRHHRLVSERHADVLDRRA